MRVSKVVCALVAVLAVSLAAAPSAWAGKDVYSCVFNTLNGTANAADWTNDAGIESIVTDLNQVENVATPSLLDEDNGVASPYNDGVIDVSTGPPSQITETPKPDYCIFVDGNDPTPPLLGDGASASGFYLASFWTSADYDSQICGTGRIKGDASQTGVSLVNPVTHVNADYATEGPLSLVYTMSLNAWQGDMTISDATNGENPAMSGSGSGHFTLSPDHWLSNYRNDATESPPYPDPAPGNPTPCINADVSGVQMGGWFNVTIDDGFP